MTYDYVFTRLAAANVPAQEYPLVGRDRVAFGREADCDILLSDKGVSRRHARAERLADGAWTLDDTGSTNGTFVNGMKVSGPQRLAPGDEITFGIAGPTIVFERRAVTADPPGPKVADPPKKEPPKPENLPKRPGGAVTPSSQPAWRLSEVLPFLSTDKTVITKSPYLVPGIITALMAVVLFGLGQAQGVALEAATSASSGLSDSARTDSLVASIHYAIDFNDVLGLYLCFALYFVVAKIAGRTKPWWLTAGVGLFTLIFIATPLWSLVHWFFGVLLPGRVDLEHESFSLSLLFRTFVGVGLPEELVKAIPIFLLVVLAPRFSPSLRAKIGINDPLDGLLIGCASAVGFTILETLGEYVGGQFTPLLDYISGSTFEATTALVQTGLTETSALQTLVPRLLGDISGHVAYSGYFGYAIGLAVIRRKNFWQIVAIGWAVSAFLHALWDSTGSIGSWASAVIAVLSYVVLLASIRRGRRVSGLSQPLVR